MIFGKVFLQKNIFLQHRGIANGGEFETLLPKFSINVQLLLNNFRQ